MKIGKKLGCMISAVILCLCSLQLPANADALSPGEWFVCKEYEVNSDGVMGYSWDYVHNGGEQEIEYSFQKGDIVYAHVAFHTMGIDWVGCYNVEPHSENAVYYGYVDMAYLSPVGSVAEEPEPEPVETDPPTDPPTEAPTTVKATTAATTVVTTILTTLAPTEAETTVLTTTTQLTTTTEQTEEVLAMVNDQNNDHKNNNFALLLIGGIVILLAGSGFLAIGLMQHNKKKQTFLPNSKEGQNTQETVGVCFCSQCGAPNPETASFCKKCGKPMK